MIPWDSCQVSYCIRNRDRIADIVTCGDLPLGWFADYAEPNLHTGRHNMVFRVQGAPSKSDGTIVRDILERLGCFR